MQNPGTMRATPDRGKDGLEWENANGRMEVATLDEGGANRNRLATAAGYHQAEGARPIGGPTRLAIPHTGMRPMHWRR